MAEERRENFGRVEKGDASSWEKGISRGRKLAVILFFSDESTVVRSLTKNFAPWRISIVTPIRIVNYVTRRAIWVGR